MYKLFIDDERDPVRDDWVIARSSAEAIKIIEERGCPQEIAFDHDLGQNDTVTRNFLRWFEDALLDGKIRMPELFTFSVHSQNPIGAAKIKGHVQALVQECLGLHAQRSLNPEKYTRTLKCTKCGHEQQATPAYVDYDRGVISMGCGSKFNYCDECDGRVEPT